ncbi:MAG: outer membrane lipoprotein-sorting protein [Spirochaetales bacterium]|nr:outer membrane lipoprotein-sorting protein [Spirochaetales bacterium]
MKYIALVILMITPAFLFSQNNPSPAEILKKIDDNTISDSKVVISRMVIHGRRGERTVRAKTWQRNTSDSFTEYLDPPREKGTKMLKLGDQLWTYSPSTDRTIMISGHMLRQSVMGSDLSYEDMMEDPFLSSLYEGEIAGSGELLGRQVWIMDLTAKKDDTAYARRKIWVDKERYLILKEELYAKSGKLLKQVDIHEVKFIEGRWIAVSATYKDVLKEGDGTEMMIESISFDENIPDYIFSKASLRK